MDVQKISIADEFCKDKQGIFKYTTICSESESNIVVCRNGQTKKLSNGEIK